VGDARREPPRIAAGLLVDFSPLRGKGNGRGNRLVVRITAGGRPAPDRIKFVHRAVGALLTPVNHGQ
jgi:hypothetical protein